MKKNRVPAEALGLAGDARLGAIERAGELPMARARGQAGGNGDEKLRELEVVGGRKRLP